MNKHFRYLFTGLTFLLFFSLNVNIVRANFPDVDSFNKSYRAISVFSTEGIIQGYPDGTFKPENQISRAEALKIILMAFSLDNNSQSEIKFSDVELNQWYAKFVAIGVNEKIINGYPDGTFKPGNQVTFVEALKMALVAKGVEIEKLEFDKIHPNLNSGQWYSEMVAYAYNSNQFEFESDGSLILDKPMNRAKFTELVYRVRSTPTNGVFNISYNWVENSGRSAIVSKFPLDWEFYDFGGNGLIAGLSNNSSDKKIDFFVNQENFVKVLMYVQSVNESLSPEKYLDEVRDDLSSSDESWEFFQEAKLDGKFLIAINDKLGRLNFYFLYNQGQVMIGESIFPVNSNKKSDYKKTIQEVFKNAKPSQLPGVGSLQERMNEVRKNILVEGKGMAVISLFQDKFIIETDSIGVGTGPVDYYFIPVINYTLKYERAADIILDISEGETFNF